MSLAYGIDSTDLGTLYLCRSAVCSQLADVPQSAIAFAATSLPGAANNYTLHQETETAFLSFSPTHFPVYVYALIST